MKYFVLGAIASGTLLYGISCSTASPARSQLDELAARIRRAPDGRRVPVLLALAFIIVGIAFKFGAVPFHMWVPDVYQGAPTPVTLLHRLRSEDRRVRARVARARGSARVRCTAAGRTC